MSACAVFGCKNCARKTNGIHYFRFPKDENLAKKWIQACKRSDKINVKTARLCSDHFSSESYFISLQQRLMNYSNIHQRKLVADAIPTENLPLQGNSDKQKSKERSERMLKRCRRKIVSDLLRDKANDYQVQVENPKQVKQLEEEQDKFRKQCSILTAEKSALSVKLAQSKRNIYLIQVENPKKLVKPLEKEQAKNRTQCSILTSEKEALPMESAQSKKNIYVIRVENPEKQVELLEEERDKCKKQCSILTSEKEALSVEPAQSKKNVYVIHLENPKKKVEPCKEELDKCNEQCSTVPSEKEALPMELAQSKKTTEKKEQTIGNNMKINDFQIRVEDLKKKVQQLEKERDKWRKKFSVLTAVKKALSMELAQSEKNIYQIQVENLKKQIKQLEEEQYKWRKQCIILTAKKEALSVELAQSKKCIIIISSNTQKLNSCAQKRKLAQENALRPEDIVKKMNSGSEPSQRT